MIEVENRGVVSVLRMARGKGNALNLALLAALAEALDALERGPARSGVITGQGSVFGAGVDLPELLAGGEGYIRRFLPKMVDVFKRLATFPKPLVAAVNGHAIAGGAIIMLACDVRLLATGSARIGLSEIQVGVLFPSWALEIARYTTPREHFSSLICTGQTWQPVDALARGLVDELVAPEGLLDRACTVASELSELAPAIFETTKLAARRPMIESAERLRPGDAAIVDNWCSRETLANIAAFAERNIKRRS